MNRLIRFLAVIAIALSPVWGFSGQVEAHNAAYPVWPSFLSTGCQIISGPTGSTTISCGVGDFLLTQVNSGYACNQLDISVSNFFSGPFTATATVNSGSQSNTVSIDSAGNYYMQFPGFLVNNLITIQIAAPDSGTMTISSIQTSTCPVPTSTPTVNPSSTATNTPVPVTGTPTAIPTFTPLPSGHSTFTRTPTAVVPTNTPINTPTSVPTARNCGTSDFNLLNCDFDGAAGDGSTAPTHWVLAASIPSAQCYVATGTTQPRVREDVNSGSPHEACHQDVTPGGAGELWMQYQVTQVVSAGSTTSVEITSAAGTARTFLDLSSCQYGSGNYCYTQVGPIQSGVLAEFTWEQEGTGPNVAYQHINVWMQPIGTATPATPVPPTSTVTLTSVPGTSTPTLTPTLTPIPIPGAMSTNIPTATECPGGCVVTQLTAIPGMATRVTVDTSPFSPFTSLSLARSTCAPFGYVAIPYPVVHGTPAYGSTTPLSVTWTIPITAPWDDTHPFSNTAIQPCAMLNEIPSTVWDFTYWFSVFAIAVVFIMWLIGFVGRLSGEETING